MVNITIDFKNNKVYLRKPYIKGGAYKLSLDSRRDPLVKLIHEDVLKLLNQALHSLEDTTKTIFAKYEYIQYDYNPREQSGFLKLIKDGKEMIHLSIFTGKKSAPHLTFSNTEGEIIHIYLADLEINDFNGGSKTTYANLLKKYNGFNDFKSICRFFYDLLNLIKRKLLSIRSNISNYIQQLSYYIDLFMNIFENPGRSKIYKGKYLENKQTTLTNMMDDEEFIAIMNREINEKKERITNFVKRNNGRITAFNGIITEFIEKNSLNDVITAIKKYKSYNSFPITDNPTNPFSYTEVFQNEANIDAFIKEFEEIKAFVEAVQLSITVKLESTIMDQYDAIVDSVDNINVIFNKGTRSKLDMILDIKNKDIQITLKQAYALERFIDTCKNNNEKLYEILDEDNIVTNKIKESVKSETKTSPPAQTNPAQTSPSQTAQTRTSPRAQTRTSPTAQTSPSPTAQTRTSPPAQTRTSPRAQTRTSPTAQTRTSPRAQTSPKPTAQTRTSPRTQTSPKPPSQTKTQSKKSKKKK